MITLLDYGAGNVRSVRNAIKKLGFTIQDAKAPTDIAKADKLIFPGVGSFGSAMARLRDLGYIEPLLAYLRADKPFLGICLGLQTLFEGSEESPGVSGLAIIPGQIGRFADSKQHLSVPQIGWNGINIRKESLLFDDYHGEKLYFVHSYRAKENDQNQEWVLTTTNYGEEFVSAVQRGNITATQFHPEKSGAAGLNLLKNFLQADTDTLIELGAPDKFDHPATETKLAKRIIACLDVRSNDNGDLVVTKGDQHDVREQG